MTESPSKSSLHPAVYIFAWVALSSGVILFNKWILDSRNFKFPIFLTTWHLASASIITQILARFTTVLDSRHKVPMTQRAYVRAILPIGLFFSLSLVCGNMAYLYLSVSFIQMLKAGAPVAVLLTTWAFRLAKPNLAVFGNICIIVVGVVIASLGEIRFVVIGVVFQLGGILFESTRLVMIQRLLSAEFKMDPLVSLYYFAPVCAITNGLLTFIFEAPYMSIADFERVGYFTLLINAACAFLLNVSSLLLIGKTSSLVLTLSGVLKNIMIVFASMIMFHDPVSSLQFLGFSIALGGLVYYQLGGAPAFSAYWQNYRSQRESNAISMSDRTPGSLESQSLVTEMSEPSPEARTEVKAA
ncbi:hypothetical protein AAFC00_004532 [Neodothiora populina]